MRATTLRIRFSSRSLRVPNIFFTVEISMESSLLRHKGIRIGWRERAGIHLSAMGATHVAGGVDRAAVFEDFKMHVGTG